MALLILETDHDEHEVMAAAVIALWILTDQLRRDSLGCYGNEICRTPHIDRLAREGVTVRPGLYHQPGLLPRPRFAAERTLSTQSRRDDQYAYRAGVVPGPGA